MPPTRRSRALVALLALAPLTAPAPAAAPLSGVLVVDDDPGPGVDFTTLQAAIDAAAEGDVLLLRPGGYAGSPFSPQAVVGKSLSIVGDGPLGTVFVHGLEVRELSAGQEVLVRKVDLGSAALRLSDNAGTVWLEAVTGVAQNFTAQSSPLVVTSSAAVHVNRCTLRGARELLTPFSALVATDSNVSIYDSTLEGASGYAILQTGADAVPVDGGSLFASGCAFVGGGGGCANDALEISGGAQVVTRDCTFTPGTPIRCVDPVPFGVGVNVVDGTHTELSGAARSLRVAAPASVGGVADLRFEGEPGDLVVLDVGTSLSSAYLPPIGTLQLGLPLGGLLALGTADGAGVFQLPLAMPPIGVEGVVLPLQVTAISGAELVLTGGSALVITAL